MNKVTDKVIGELYVGSCRLDDFTGLAYFIKYNELVDDTKTKCKEIGDAQIYDLRTTDMQSA